jgi:hypothetical protein
MKRNPSPFLLWIALIAFAVQISNAQWIQTNGPWNGTIESLAASEGNIFAGTFGCGVFLSTNGGASWTPVNSGLPDVTHGSVRLLAAGGGALIAVTSNRGVFASTDNGAAWREANAGLIGKRVEALIEAGGAFYAGTRDSGVLISTNKGESWNAINDGLMNLRISSLAKCGTTIIAGTGAGVALLSSVSEAGWVMASDSGHPETSRITSLAAQGNSLFAGTWDSGIYVSSNSGASWSAANYGLAFMSRDTSISLGYIPAFAACGNCLFAGTYDNGVFASYDNGATWATVNNGLTSLHVSSFAVRGNTIFAGTRSGGVCLSTNNGKNWIAASSGISYASVHALVANGKSVFAGTFNNVYLSTDNGENWGDPILGGALTLAVNGNDILAGTPGNGLFLSTNDGASWNEIGSGISVSYEKYQFDGSYVSALALSGSHIFAGGYGLYHSADYGKTWAEADAGMDDKNISSLAVSQGALFAGSSCGSLYVSTSNAANWKDVNLPGAGRNECLVYVLGRGNVFASVGEKKFLSPDNGATWQQADRGYPAINCVTIKGDTLFAGSFSGAIFMTADNGKSWSAKGFGPTGIQSLAVSSDNIFAGISTGSVWRRPLSELTGVNGHNGQASLSQQFRVTTHSSDAASHMLCVDFSLPYPGAVVISAHNLSGRKIGSLVSGQFCSGIHTYRWDTRTMAPGCYIVSMRTELNTFIKSMPIFVRN